VFLPIFFYVRRKYKGHPGTTTNVMQIYWLKIIGVTQGKEKKKYGWQGNY
jgi:hypothetical protein